MQKSYVTCRYCGAAYQHFSATVVDQSMCSHCREEFEKASKGGRPPRFRRFPPSYSRG